MMEEAAATMTSISNQLVRPGPRRPGGAPAALRRRAVCDARCSAEASGGVVCSGVQQATAGSRSR